MTDSEFLAAFFDLRLTGADFSHQAHLRLAYLLARKYPADIAIDKASVGIQKLAAALGAADKYHATLTYAFMCIVSARIKQKSAATFAQFLEQNQDLVTDAQAVISQYYSPSCLANLTAKQQALEPDLQAFANEEN